LKSTGLWAGLVLTLAAGCQIPHRLEMPSLASAQVSNDFKTYELRRVGLLPFAGSEIDDAAREAFQLAFLSEISQSTPYEVVLLDRDDLEEIDESEPYRRGWYRPRTIIELSRRYSLDAILFGTVTQQRSFPPQLLSLEVEMVAAETGLVIWSSSVHLDANDTRVVDGLKIYWGDKEDARAWELALISPERFARFAAFQVACLL
jgi:hypothetical protein